MSGPDEARKAVRENLAIGADMVKLSIDDWAGAFWKFRYLAPEDVKAVTKCLFLYKALLKGPLDTESVFGEPRIYSTRNASVAFTLKARWAGRSVAPHPAKQRARLAIAITAGSQDFT